jgi:hypothetical protein
MSLTAAWQSSKSPSTTSACTLLCGRHFGGAAHFRHATMRVYDDHVQTFGPRNASRSQPEPVSRMSPHDCRSLGVTGAAETSARSTASQRIFERQRIRAVEQFNHLVVTVELHQWRARGMARKLHRLIAMSLQTLRPVNVSPMNGPYPSNATSSGFASHHPAICVGQRRHLFGRVRKATVLGGQDYISMASSNSGQVLCHGSRCTMMFRRPLACRARNYR